MQINQHELLSLTVQKRKPLPFHSKGHQKWLQIVSYTDEDIRYKVHMTVACLNVYFCLHFIMLLKYK